MRRCLKFGQKALLKPPTPALARALGGFYSSTSHNRPYVIWYNNKLGRTEPPYEAHEPVRVLACLDRWVVVIKEAQFEEGFALLKNKKSPSYQQLLRAFPKSVWVSSEWVTSVATEKKGLQGLL